MRYRNNKMKFILLFFLFTILSSCSDIDESDFIWTNDFGGKISLTSIVLNHIKDSILVLERYPFMGNEITFDSINLNNGIIINSFLDKDANTFGMGQTWIHRNLNNAYWDSKNLNSFDKYNTSDTFKYELMFNVRLDATRPLLLFGDKHERCSNKCY